MPVPDHPPPKRRRPAQGPLRIARWFKRGKRRDKDDGGVPVEPNRPNTLSGGAAAELEFDD